MFFDFHGCQEQTKIHGCCYFSLPISPSYYSLELSSNGTKMYLVLRHRSSSEIYWSSEEFFSFVPEKGLNYLYNFSHVSNDNETYLTYDVYNSSIISRFMIDISGQIKQMNWLPLAQKWNLFWLQPKQECAVYGFCGAYGVCNGNNFPFCSCLIGFEAKLPRDRSLKDYSGGCQRKTELLCGDNGLANGDKDRFTKIPSMVLSGYKNSLQIRNIAACESPCLGDCSCTAYAYDNSSSCLIWSGDLLNLKQVTTDDRKGETLYIRLAASEFPSSKKIVSVKKIITYVSSAAAFAVVLGLIVFVILRRRKKIVGMGKALEDSLVYYVEDEVSFFPIFVATVIIEGGDVVSLLDPRLEGKVDAEELIRVCRLACWCIQYEETQRPSMGQIVQILDGLTNVNLPPLPRLFQATVKDGFEVAENAYRWGKRIEACSTIFMDTKTKPRFMVTAIFLCLFVPQVSVVLGADTISVNQSLSGDQTVVSADGVFELGFFTPGNSLNYYIGIWYKQISKQTIVWVANREKPVSDRFSSVLRISDGNLVLYNESQAPIWSTNVNHTTSGTVQAVLLNKGNLVINYGSNLSTPLWQSFDYPSHTFLPGSKLGFNKKTKNNSVLLTSWKNSEDPAPGYYSLELFLIGTDSYMVLWNRSSSEIYWSSGYWNGKIFSLVPEMRLNYIFNYSFVSNENEIYFTYDVYDNYSTISRLVIDVTGQIKQQNWLGNGWMLFWSQPREQCDVYAYCGAYGSCNDRSLPFCNCLTGFEPKSQSNWDMSDYSDGCQRKTELQCQHSGKRDRFTTNPGMVSGNEKSVKASNSAECESTCLNDCSCTAYAYENNNCLIWIGDLFNLKQVPADDSRGMTLYVRLAASESSPNKIVINVVASAGAFALLLGLIKFIVLRWRKMTVGSGKAMEGEVSFFPIWAASIIIEGGDVFSLLDPRLEGNADPERLIRVCRLACWCIHYEETQRPSMGQIVQILEGLINVNLPPLPRLFQAFVDNPDEIISSTESSSSAESSQAGNGMSTASSRQALYVIEGGLWSQPIRPEVGGNADEVELIAVFSVKFALVLRISGGNLVLFNESHSPIWSTNVNPTTSGSTVQAEAVLLDDGNLVLNDGSNPSTLPLWQSFDNPCNTFLAGGEIGYTGINKSNKIVLTSWKNSEDPAPGEVSFFSIWAASIIVEGGDVFSLLDLRLEGNADLERLSRVCRLACWCLQYEETQRPSMGQIVRILEGLLNVNLPLLPRLFQAFVDNPDKIISSTVCTSSSAESSQAGNGMSTASSRTKPTLLVATAMFLLLLSLQVSVSLGADTISANQSLSGGNLSERSVSDKFAFALRISSEAVLLDNGNLVLNDGSNPPTLPLWQSFDHPCNTFLPDGRIGYTGINKSNKIVLTSWKNSEDPAPGDYSLEQFLIGSEVYFVMRNRSSSEIS
ncbi:hypothetical protein FEM48_Zijuj04G0079600 [Ziziphus jujuba var. spinosa]|uniref:Uncharacterized protein n=1 Tax=Ziziphus jujuba var. spinosa TaxID=714518 RepID=A0A978VIP9_ZIZJJ|nr:hypothetical protein FEM48_Zijuj04G0079600 [Ziziphus jujuba var. spinosa]